MLTLVLQAGGESTRMGMDKALLPFLGTPLIQRLRDRFQGLEGDILVISNHPEDYHFLEIPVFKDSQPGRGALGGLLTALMITKGEYLGLIAADMPFASPSLLDYLIKEIQSSGADAALPSSPGGPEPLHAVYRRSTCLPLVQEAVSSDLWRMNAWHDQARIQILDQESSVKASGSPYTFMNLNTLEEFRDAEALALDFNLL